MTRLDEIHARLDAATPGPWEWAGASGDCVFVGDHCQTDHGWKHAPCFDVEPSVVGSWGYDADGVTMTIPDATLIAAAPADLRYLLERVRMLESVAGTATRALTWADESMTYKEFRDAAHIALDVLRAALTEGESK